MSKGRIIILEGIDGSGKSTVAQILKEKLGAEVVSFPTQDAKSLIADAGPQMPVMSSVIFYIQDMFDELRLRIAPLIEQGKDVVLDRFWPSTVVYQGERLCRRVADASQHALIMAQMLTVAKRLMDLAMREEFGNAGDVHLFTLTMPYMDAVIRALNRGNEPDQYEKDIDKVWDFRSRFYSKVSFDDGEEKVSVLGKDPGQVAEEIMEHLK